MTAPLIVPNVPGRNAAARRRRVRNTTVGGVIALLIAAGGYGAMKTFGPDAHAPEPAPATG